MIKRTWWSRILKFVGTCNSQFSANTIKTGNTNLDRRPRDHDVSKKRTSAVVWEQFHLSLIYSSRQLCARSINWIHAGWIKLSRLFCTEDNGSIGGISRQSADKTAEEADRNVVCKGMQSPTLMPQSHWTAYSTDINWTVQKRPKRAVLGASAGHVYIFSPSPLHSAVLQILY